jgi:hypothetical protein
MVLFLSNESFKKKNVHFSVTVLPRFTDTVQWRPIESGPHNKEI